MKSTEMVVRLYYGAAIDMFLRMKNLKRWFPFGEPDREWFYYN